MKPKEKFESWTTSNLESQAGKTIIVTGANTGIGYWTALGLAKYGAKVIVAGRNQNKIDKAVEEIKKDGIEGSVEGAIIDLASLDSVRAFAQKFNSSHERLDVLINNAGVMMPPESKTEDGFELQFGVNFLAHFLLTQLLLEKLKASDNGRVVSVSSIAHRNASIDFENLRSQKSYDARREYCQSKLANSVFALELDRRFGAEILSLACHPGITESELQRHVDPAFLAERSFMETWQGSLPTLVAATKKDIQPHDYYGPDGDKEWAGFPALGVIDDVAFDPALGKELWKFGMSVV